MTTAIIAQQAELSVAAYASLASGITNSDRNRDALFQAGLATSQVDAFAARHPRVVAQFNDTAPEGGLGTSLSATVFADNAGNLTVSFRGVAELFSTPNDVPASLDIVLQGAAYDQIVAMVNWWNRVASIPGQMVDQYRFETYSPEAVPTGAVVLQNIGSAVLVLESAPQIAANGSLMPALTADSDGRVELTGHSLGGHLSMAFSTIFQGRAGQVTVFNAPGFKDNATNQAFFAKLGGSVPVSASLINVAADEALLEADPLNLISGMHSRPGQRIDIPIEDQAGTDETAPIRPSLNHSIVTLADSLAIYKLLTDLDPTLTTNAYRVILNQAVRGTAAGYERIVDALGKLLTGAESFLPVGNAYRDALHEAINRVRGELGARAGIVEVISPDPIDVLQKTQLGGAAGLAYRYAIRELNPFAVIDAANTGLYARFQSGGAQEGELDAYNRVTNPRGLTDRYLADRAQMLGLLMQANAVDVFALASSDAANQRLYFDLVRRPDSSSPFIGKPLSFFVYAPNTQPDFTASNWRITAFGTDSPDALQGRHDADRLYGGKGADVLTGGEGNDYLEGGAGMDVYSYRAEANILSPNVNDGDDELLDTDGRGAIRYTFTGSGSSGTTSRLIGGAALKLTPTTWQSYDGKFAYNQQGSDLVVTINGDAGGSVTIRGFNFAQAESEGYLGIRLVDQPSAPDSFARTFFGDKEDWDSDANAANGVQTEPDAFGNTKRADGQDGRPDVAQADRADTFFGSAADEAEKFVMGGGDDIVYADGPSSFTSESGGRDLIEAGAGRDIVTAGAGNDWVEGGAGGDILAGNLGDDTICGDSSVGQSVTLAQAIAAGETGGVATVPGDFITGDAGNDTIVGSAIADLIYGGAGADVVVGGAGADNIYGDGEVTAAALDWSATRNVTVSGQVRTFTLATVGIVASHALDVGSADLIYGGSGADWIFGGAGDDYLDGGNSAADANVDDDVLFGEAGSDILVGGSGKDFLYGDSATVDAAGLSGDDYLDGGAGDDELFGGKGDDILIGGDGDDLISDGDGDDVIWGGRGDDILIKGAGKDTYVYERGDGTDRVLNPDNLYGMALALGPGIAASDVKFRVGSLMVDLGSGDAIHFDGFNPDDPTSTPVLESIQFADGTVMTYQDILDQGFDLDGTEGDDVIEGTAVTDRIDGKGGNDTITGKAGNDVILGGAGNDAIDGGAGDDVLDGGDGVDIIEAGEGNDTITTGAGADIVLGGAGDDLVYADDGDILIDGEGTNSVDLTAYAGLDISKMEVTQYQAPDGEAYLNLHIRDDLNVGATPASGGVSIQRGELGDFATFTLSDGQGGTVTLGAEELITGYGAHGFVYRGRDAAENLAGTTHADTIFGGGGADTIEGNAGDDRIDGGAGDDTLVGGEGNDTYLLAFNGGRDVVIEDGAAEPGASHTVQLDSDVTSAMVYARRSGDDLEVHLRATDDALILKDFYLQPQSWQEGWSVRDAAGTSYTLASYLPIVPPPAETWLDEEKAAFHLRREQVYLANRRAEGFSPIGGGGGTFARIQNTFDYSTAVSNGDHTTQQLVVDELENDLAFQFLDSTLTSTPLGGSTASYTMRLPGVTGAGGARTAVSDAFGGGPSSGPSDTEFVPVGNGLPGMNGAGVRVENGDVVVPVYRAKVGAGKQIVNAGSASYASAGGFGNGEQWELAGYTIQRAGTGAETREGDIQATHTTPAVYDLRLIQEDLVAGSGDNTVIVNQGSALVEGGDGNDNIQLGAGNFVAAPGWREAFGQPGSVIPRFLGGFASGGAGEDTIAGSLGQDVLAGGDGADWLQGNGGSDRYLAQASDTGIDQIAETAVEPFEYLEWFYWNRGIFDWHERAQHGNEWRVAEDGPGRFYFKTEAEADQAIATNLGYGGKTFISALTEAAPRLTRDDALYQQAIDAGVLSRDVLEFGPGFSLANLQITVEVDAFSAQDYPDRPWLNGGNVSIRWGGGTGGVDFHAAPVNGGHEGPDLLSGGWIAEDQADMPDGSWRGYRLGEGIEAFRFADGTTLTLDELLANASVVPVGGNYVLRRDSGYRLVDKRYGAIELTDGISAGEVQVARDGLDLLVTVPFGSQARIQGWYADPANAPQTSLLFEFEPPIDAAALSARGLELHGGPGSDTLTALDGFPNPLFGEGGDDTLVGGTGDDLLDGGSGNDVALGGGGDDLLDGGSESDVLLGGAGADRLVSGTGDDTLDGGAGEDTYVFNLGDGVDAITEVPDGTSVIQFSDGIESWQARLSLDGSGSLVVSYSEADAVRFTGFSADDPYSTPVFDRLEFSGGDTITYTDLLDQGFSFSGTGGDDSISGTGIHDFIQGLEGDDTLAGLGGDDELYGGSGDDTLAGGSGDDYLQGDEGSDTYVYAAGDGADYIADFGSADDIDRLQLEGIAPGDVRVTTNGDSYYLVFPGADRLTIEGMASDATAGVEFIEFAGDTVWTAADLAARVELLPGTPLDDVLWGTDEDDIIDGLEGNDAIYGNAGDDRLDGGADSDFIVGGDGNDLLFGGEGDDSLSEGGEGNNLLDAGEGNDYVFHEGHSFVVGGTGDDWIDNYGAGGVIAFNPGDGHDTVYAADGFTLSIGGGIAPADLSLSADGDDLILQVGEGDAIRLSRQFEEDPRAWPEITLQLFGSVHTYDFDAVIGEFYAALGADPELGAFALDGVLQANQIGTSTTEAFGGALAYTYGTTGSLESLSEPQIRQVLSDADFGTTMQPISVETANRTPAVSAADGAVLRNEAVAAGTLFSVSDADGDAIVQYEFWDDVAGGGYFSLDGVAQGTNPIGMSAAQLAGLQYVGGTEPGTERVWVRANDGTEWGAWQAWNMTTALHIPNAAPEVSVAASRTILLDEIVAAGGLFDAADGDGDPLVRYEFWDSTAGGGHFAVDGVEQGVNVAITVADLESVAFVGASSAASDLVWVRASDGQSGSDWKSWTMNSWPHATNAAPVVSASDLTMLTNEVVAAGALFSVTDADGDAPARYEFWDDVSGGGYFRMNGVQQGAVQAIAVAAADLADVEYVGGASGGTERVWVRAHDGLEWGAWKSWNITSALHIPNAAPVVSAAGGTVLLGRSVDASSLFSVADADADAITAYEFWDSTAGNGHFAVAGIQQGVNVAIPVADLQDVEFVGAESAGQDLVWVRAYDGQTWSDWKSWTMNSWPHLDNTAPLAAASDNGLLRGEAIAAASLFSVTDADGDAMVRYELWDDVNGGGFWRKDGVQQAAGQTIAVGADELASTDYVGGANAGTERVWVRASDGLAWGTWKSWLMSTEGGMLRGGFGPDTLSGEAGPTVLEGGDGDDELTDVEGDNLFSGGDGDDTMSGGDGDELFVGGTGDDTIATGAGNNVIAFNAGDGTDTVVSALGASNTLSLGGGIGYEGLSLSKVGDDLVVNTGANDHVVLKDWYAGNDTVTNLQLMLDASDEFDANSSDPLHNRKVQTFDFLGLVGEFDQALAASPGLTSWAVTNALLQFHLSGSDDAAVGGDLAYWYGKNGGLTGISLAAAQQVIGAPGFGSDAQSLRPFSGLQDGFVKLS